jgi:hypothetical protein
MEWRCQRQFDYAAFRAAYTAKKRRSEYAALEALPAWVMANKRVMRVMRRTRRLIDARSLTGRLGTARPDYSPVQAKRAKWWKRPSLWADDAPARAAHDGQRSLTRPTEDEALENVYVRAKGSMPVSEIKVITAKKIKQRAPRGWQYCVTCHQYKAPDAFGSDPRNTNRDGLQSYCLACEAQRKKEARARKKKRQQRKQNAAQRASAYSRVTAGD